MTIDKLKAMIAEAVKAAVGEEVALRMKEAQSPDVMAAMARAAAMAQAGIGGNHVGAKEDKTLMIGRLVRALAGGKGDPEKALKFANDVWKDKTVSAVFEKALAAGSAPAGGFLIPVEYSTELISFLRARAIVRKMGPTVMPMGTGTISIPKVSSGAAAAYVGENTNIAKSEQGFGSLTLTYKKLAVLTPVSNDLFRFASPSADTVVRNDLVQAMAVREDLAFIRGDGTANTPKGIRNWIPSVNVIAANVTVNLTNVTHDLAQLLLALKNANAPMVSLGWMFSPRTEMYLMTLLTTNGVYAFREEMLTGKLWGFPYATTTQIPNNLGAGQDSEVYLVDFSDVVLGESEQIILDTSTEAAYFDGSAVIAAFSQDQTVVRAMAMHDIGMRHDPSAAVLTTVQWQ